jgi:hypothetical protein
MSYGDFSYNAWIDQETASVQASLDSAFRMRGYSNDIAIFVIPSKGSEPGKLVISDTPLAGLDVVHFPAQGSRAMAVPRAHLRSLLWRACRHLPICPTA